MRGWCVMRKCDMCYYKESVLLEGVSCEGVL